MNRPETTTNSPQEPVDAYQFYQQESSPYQPDEIEIEQGPVPAFVRRLPHLIILWSVGYVVIQAESNIINYVTAALLVLWSGYNLLAVKKKWPPFP
jgi:hypothetical protein